MDVLNLRHLTEAAVRQAHMRAAGHTGAMAELLGVSRKTVYNLMVRYGMHTVRPHGSRP